MPMKILVLEDDIYEVKKIENIASSKSDIEIVDVTSSCYDALNYLKHKEIEGIIVDIELNKGLGGSGLDFLRELNSMELQFRPLIIVTTRNESEAVHNACRDLKVDMIYYKSKEDYSPCIVFNQFLLLRPYLVKKKVANPKSKLESELERRHRIEKLISEEFNLIGMPANMKGYRYAFDAILYIIENGSSGDCYYTDYLYEKYKVRKSGISTSIQDSINSAWRNSAEEDILDNFDANITYNRGTPTPTQFIHYYVEKIKLKI